MTILDKIIDAKTDYIHSAKKVIPNKRMKKMAEEIILGIPSFGDAMKKPGLSVIGEIKKASPSKGVIDPVFDYRTISEEYNSSADAISVLTEEDYFLGNPGMFAEIAGKVEIPVLRKDFIIDGYQIFESRVIGASCVLLIAAVLDSGKMKEFISLCSELGMDSLVEVHDETELYRALGAGAGIIGINNRDLSDFSVNVSRTETLGRLVPEGITLISESGIKTAEDAKTVRQAGADGILVGESLMRSHEKKKLIKEFKSVC